MTRMQLRAFVIINDSINARGIPPTFDQIAAGLGVKSKSGVARILDALEERGYIRRIPNRARAIEIIKRPPGISDPVQAERDRCRKIAAIAVAGDCTVVEAATAIANGVPLDYFERRHWSPSFRRAPSLV